MNLSKLVKFPLQPLQKEKVEIAKLTLGSPSAFGPVSSRISSHTDVVASTEPLVNPALVLHAENTI